MFAIATTIYTIRGSTFYGELSDAAKRINWNIGEQRLYGITDKILAKIREKPSVLVYLLKSHSFPLIIHAVDTFQYLYYEIFGVYCSCSLPVFIANVLR